MSYSRLAFIFLAMSLSLGKCSDEEYMEQFEGMEIPLEANAPAPLRFENYLGNTENIHPKVLYFPEGWNGFEFWMAYTPYPRGRNAYENPSLAVSHDGIAWETPPGVTNPLSPKPEDGYNSDTHLVYDKDNDCLEIWWRPFDSPGARDSYVRRVSSDGVNWGPTETTVDWGKRNDMRLSGSVWIEDGLYKMIYCDSRQLLYVESKGPQDGWKWSGPLVIPVEWGEIKPWHLDAIKDEATGKIQMVVCAYTPDGNFEEADLYYLEADAGLNSASSPTLILRRSLFTSCFDYRSIYRASIVRVGSNFYVYYSALDQLRHRHMGLTIGRSPLQLKGYDPSC